MTSFAYPGWSSSRSLALLLREPSVNAETAADIYELKRHAESAELRIELRNFTEAGLDLADVRDLVSEMEVNELEAVVYMSLGLDVIEGSGRSEPLRPNLLRYPPDSSHLPEPLLASLMRMPMPRRRRCGGESSTIR